MAHGSERTGKTIAETFSEYLMGFAFGDFPADVVERTKDAILDQLGCQLIGSTMPWNAVIYDMVKGFEGRAESTVVRHGLKTLAHDAAFVNATFGQGCELDDAVRRGGPPGGHPGAMCMPVALALGEQLHIDGKTMIAAVVAGYEAALRLGLAMPGTRDNGFHNQNVFGPFVCTTVASHMLGASSAQLAQAMAIAGSHCSGTTEFDRSGGEVKRMHAGLAARGGMQSATLAMAGLTGPLTIFEGKQSGILHCYASQEDPDSLIRDLGDDYAVRHIGYKTLPVVGNIQSPINVMAGLVDRYDLKPADVVSIEVGLGKRPLVHGASIVEPQDTVGAQFSLAFSLAIRLLKRSNDLKLYLDSWLWRHPDVLAIAHKVKTHHDTRLVGDKDKGSHVKLTLADGRVVEAFEEYLKGDQKNPLSRDELADKFRRLAAGSGLSAARSEEVVDIVLNLEAVDDVSRLAALLVADRPH